MSNEFNQTIIEQYLNKQLSGQVLKDFENQMNTDESFKKEVSFQALLYRGANKLGEDDLRASLKQMRKEVLAESSEEEETNKESPAKVVSIDRPKDKRTFLKWSIAAAIALALGSLLFLMDDNKSNGTEDLYAAYYQPFSGEITTRGVVGDIQEANTLYRAGKYAEALPKLGEMLEEEPSNAALQLAKGICHLELNQSGAAIQIFESVNNPLYKEQANWYLAMTYLKNKEYSKAKNSLQNIQKGDSNFLKAQNILEKL